MEQLNIYQRLNAIKKDVAYIQKDKEVTGAGSYMAVTHDAVTAATRAKFVEHGVMVVPTELSSVVADSGMTTGKGNPIIRFEARYRVSFINVDSPEDLTSIELTSHALDQGDKAPGKAVSYAVKYAVLKVLQMETGEDEESREATKPKNQTKEQAIIGANVQPNAGAMDNIPKERREYVNRTANTIIDYWNAEQPKEAFAAYGEIKENEEKLAIWSLLDSKLRRALKELGGAQAPVANKPGERKHGAEPVIALAKP